MKKRDFAAPVNVFDYSLSSDECGTLNGADFVVWSEYHGEQNVGRGMVARGGACEHG
jgi:hypothetical protein